MKILFFASVAEELPSSVFNHTKIIKILDKEICFLNNGKNEFYFFASGIGVLNTAFYLTLAISKIAPDLIIQVGIGGAFKNSGLKIGDIAIAEKEIFVDQSEIKNIKKVYETNKKINSFLENILKKEIIKKGIFITSSTVTTSENRTKKFETEFEPIIENMEGASLFHCANLFKTPYAEIRAVSNFVGERDKQKWNTKLAFENINRVVKSIMTAF